jgi:hypothetical protein
MASIDWNGLLSSAQEAEGQNGGEVQLLPAGSYDVRVKTAKAKKTSTGKDQILVVFEVLSGPYAGSPLFKNLVISPGSSIALDIFFRDLGALGVARDYFAANPQLEDVCEKVKGVTATVTTKQKEFPQGSGRLSNEVTSIKANATSAAPTPAAAPAPTAQAPIPTAAPAVGNGSAPVPF